MKLLLWVKPLFYLGPFGMGTDKTSSASDSALGQPCDSMGLGHGNQAHAHHAKSGQLETGDSSAVVAEVLLEDESSLDRALELRDRPGRAWKGLAKREPKKGKGKGKSGGSDHGAEETTTEESAASTTSSDYYTYAYPTSTSTDGSLFGAATSAVGAASTGSTGSTFHSGASNVQPFLASTLFVLLGLFAAM